MADTWGEISLKFHESMGDEYFAPAFHSYTEGIFKDKTLPLKERYVAWMLRTAWGNSSEFCCKRDRTLEREPMLQADAARALGVSPKSISLWTRRFVREGRIRVDAEGRIILNKVRGESIYIKTSDQEKSPYIERWRADFPQGAREMEEARHRVEKDRAIIEKWRTHQKNYIKHVSRSGNASPAPVTGSLFSSGNTDVQGSGNDLSPAPVTPAVSPNIGPRATLNSKQEQTLVSEWLRESAARELARSLTEIKQVVEQAYGAPLQENDPIPGRLLAKAKDLDLPVPGLCRWIQDFAKKKRDGNYDVTSPMLFVTAAEKDLPLWVRKNADLVYRLQFQLGIQGRERQAAVEVMRNPAAPDDQKQWARQVLRIADVKGATP